MLPYIAIVPFFVSGITACSSGSDTETSDNESRLRNFRPALINIDSNNDGLIDRTFNMVYDANGLLTGELIDLDLDGNYENEIRYNYEDGNIVSTIVDNDRDGTTNLLTQFSYDSSGTLLSQTTQEALNGPLTSRTDYLQNASGVLTGANVDFDANGSVDEVASYRFNSGGTLEEAEFDTNFDDVANIIIQFTYGPFGEALTRTRRLSNNRVTSIWTYSYEEGLCDPIGELQPRIATCVTRP